MIFLELEANLLGHQQIGIYIPRKLMAVLVRNNFFKVPFSSCHVTEQLLERGRRGSSSSETRGAVGLPKAAAPISGSSNSFFIACQTDALFLETSTEFVDHFKSQICREQSVLVPGERRH